MYFIIFYLFKFHSYRSRDFLDRVSLDKSGFLLANIY